jgi:hypothetical protein
LIKYVKSDSFITVTSLRRERRARKKGSALGNFISDQLDDLRTFRDYLNDEPSPLADLPSTWPADHVAHVREQERILHWGWEQAREVAALGASHARLPTAIVRPLRALAEAVPVTYQVAIKRSDQGSKTWDSTGSSRSRYTVRLPSPRTDVLLEQASPSAALRGLTLVVGYLRSAQRHRLRRCPQCRGWFVDETRNNSAQRCSRACTIAWSNAQRKESR